MSKNTRIVISFGRFNPPTTGHALLVQFVAAQAARLRADAVIFPSQSQDAAKNPLPFREKVQFLRQLFGHQMNFSDNAAIRTPVDALTYLSSMGYREVHVVVGSDRVAEFEKFGRYVKPVGTRGTNVIPLDKYAVIPVPGERNAAAPGVSGMSASKMRAFAAANDFAKFRQGVPTRTDAVARQLYRSVRKHMGVQKESLAYFTYGVTAASSKTLCEALAGRKFRDLTNADLPAIRQAIREAEASGCRVVFYTRNEPSPLTESAVLFRQATYGLLKRELASRIIEVRSATSASAVEDVRAHATRLEEDYGHMAVCRTPGCHENGVSRRVYAPTTICLTCHKPMSNLAEGDEAPAALDEATVENPFHKIFIERGFGLSKVDLNVPNPLMKTALHDQWLYTHQRGKRSYGVVTKYHKPNLYGKQWHWRFFHEQDNGIMAPTVGDTKPQLIRTLERDHYVVSEAADGAPKQPTEVDRLKNQQKQQSLVMKVRQSQELLQAKQRELQKKSREDQNKIASGDKKPSITR